MYLKANEVDNRLVNFAIFFISVCISIFCILVFIDNQSVKSISATNLQVNNGSVQYYIDDVNIGKHTININGWAVKQGEDLKNVKTYVGLKNVQNNDILMLNTEMTKRDDLNNYFNDGHNYQNGGYFAKVLKYKLREKEKYEVCIIYQSDENNILVDTDKFVEL
jgi:hypothetical protein